MSMQRLPIPFLGGALFWALLMPSAVAADLPQGVDPKEWAAFNAAAERFHDRAEELHADVVAEVEDVHEVAVVVEAHKQHGDEDFNHF